MRYFVWTFLIGVNSLFAVDEARGVNEKQVRAFLKAHCVKCHGEKKQKGKLALHQIGYGFTDPGEVRKWEDVLEQLTLGEMPPEEEKQPSAKTVKEIRAWISRRLHLAGKDPEIEHKMKQAAYGNLASHEKLFDGSVKAKSFSKARLWRTNPRIYDLFVDRFGRQLRGATAIAQPFTIDEQKGEVSDFAATLYADGATLQRLMMNCKAIAQYQTVGIAKQQKDRKNKGQFITRIYRNTPEAFKVILEGEETVTKEEIEAAVKVEFEIVLNREPSKEELDRYGELLRRTIAQGGRVKGLQTMLMAVLLRPEAFYRMEYGLGKVERDGRRMLSAYELAFAISYALTDAGPDKLMLGPVDRRKRRGGPSLLDLARSGKLSTREDVKRVVTQIMKAKDIDKPRILRFFHEFFGYSHAATIFKGNRIGREFNVKKIVRDADQMVMHIVEKDKDVLRELLTSDRFFVAFPGSKEAYQRTIDRMMKHEGKNKKHPTTKYLVHQRKKGWNPIPEANPTWRKYVKFYNFEEMNWNYPVEQPFAMPKGQRAGILTHPAWLIAWSGNFDNDVVRRGKWIREHLLAGMIPEVPITVNAAVPDDVDKTLRQRMEVTRDAYCWKCHKRMDPLGLAFEMFDDFGRYRKVEQTRDKKKHPAIARGAIINSKESGLDGDVKDAIELVHRLGGSTRVRQSFVRHAFRYWMGRNEKLSDSRTLIAADGAYVDGGGSFKALVISLLTSDSFLYRK